MSRRNQRISNNLKTQRKAKIVHAKVVLFLLAAYGIVHIIYLYLSLREETFLPVRYIYMAMGRTSILVIPFIVSIFSKKTGFIIGILFAIYTVFIIGMHIGMLIFLYILVSQIIGLMAILEKEKLDKTPTYRDDILDNDIF